MRFNYLKINGYGKLREKEIDFKDGINLIYGENESGKSTVLRFIFNMLYGASKNKKGKDISDLERFNPWNNEEFSGKIGYTFKEEDFEVYREFKKKAPKIFNSKMEEISEQYKNKGTEFFEEQTGIDENTFLETAMVEQEGSKLSEDGQTNIVQKMGNKIETGKDNISFKKALEKINKAQLERVGNNKSSQKPLNIVKEQILKLKQEKEKNTSLEALAELENKNNKLAKDIEVEEIRLSALKEYKKELEDSKMKNAEISFSKNLADEYDEKIQEIQKQIDENNNKKLNKLNVFLFVIGLLFVIFLILSVIYKQKSIIISSCASGLVEVVLIILKIIKNKKENKDNGNLKNRLSILEKDKKEKEIEIENKNNDLEKELTNKKEKISEKYSDKLDNTFLESLMVMEFDEVQTAIDNKEKNLNNLKIQISVNEKEKSYLEKEKEENLAKEEKLKELYEEEEELEILNNNFNMAKECLNDAYLEMKESISPAFQNNLSETISKISNGKYKKVKFDDKTGLTVETENGNYVSAKRLSIGTLDQMYLSLRISAISEISSESIPLIFDESFAYYDDNRLENILKYISEELDNQVLIFTCSKREKEILDKQGINYNLINL